MKLLTYNSAKIEHSNEAGTGYRVAVMYLAPYTLSGHNVCPNATPGCIEACLNTAGRGRFDNVQQAKLNRTKFFYSDHTAFLWQLAKEIDRHVTKAERLGVKPAIRLNGTSDIAWEHLKFDLGMTLMEMFPQVQFYDYTKSKKRVSLDYKLPANYTLTYSFNETDFGSLFPQAVMNIHRNVAVVFETVPETWNGWKVINGDAHDMRFLDPTGVIVGLRAKGKAKQDTSGFVVRS